MSGTKAGAKKTSETNRRKYGEDYYAKIALKSQESWEANGRKPRGFAALSPERLKEIQDRAVEANRRRAHEKQGNT